MNEMNGITPLNVYLECLLRVKNYTADYRDRTIIQMWEDRAKHRIEMLSLKEELKDRDKTIGEQNAALEIFHSRVDLGICGQSNVGAWLKGWIDSSQIMNP